MFSAIGVQAVTFTGVLSRAMAVTAASTAAAPPMSDFIASMPGAGLIEMPPLSKVIPLPTSARWRVARGWRYATRISRGGFADP